MHLQRSKKRSPLNFLDYLGIGLATAVLCWVVGGGQINMAALIWLTLVAALIWYLWRFKSFSPLKDFLSIALLLFCTMIIYRNWEPWFSLTNLFFSGDWNGAKIFTQIPVIGGMFSGLGWLVVVIISVVPFLTIVLLELAPSIINNNREGIKFTISRLEAQRNEILSDDNPENDDQANVLEQQIADLKRQHDMVIVNTYRNFRRFRIWAYVIDAVICFWYYPPLLGGWASFAWGWPAADEWDYPNLFTCGIILFGLQLIVELYLWLQNASAYLTVREVSRS